MKKFRFYLLTLISLTFLILPFKRVEASPTIKRLEEIVGTEANRYFWELYSDKKTIRTNSQFRRCATDYKNKNIVICLTNNGSFSNGRDVLWYFDMKQKLAFKIGGYKAGEGPCNLNKVRIIGMYNDGQFANENDIPIDLKRIADLIVLFKNGKLTNVNAKKIFNIMLTDDRTASEIMEDEKMMVIEDDNFLNDIVKEVQKRRLSDLFFFLGNVGHEQLPEIYAATDVFLLTSDNESFGRVIIESYLSIFVETSEGVTI